MEHHFNVDIAKEHGIEEAILLNHLYFWIAKNAATDTNFHDGMYWTFNTKRTYVGLFPYLNETKIYRVISHFIDEGILVRGNYNKDKFDRTNWYAITTNGLEYLKSKGYDIQPFTRMLQNDTLEQVKMNNGACQNERTIPDIIPDNNKREIDKSISQKESDAMFEECWKAYRRKGAKGKSKPYWGKLTDGEKRLVLPHIKAYVSSRELQFQQDFQRYLRDKTFTTIVIHNNIVVYDPSKSVDNDYHPQDALGFGWNEHLKCYLYTGYDTRFIPDGYDDNNRPDGAMVVLNNARGKLIWSKELKQWVKQ